MSKKDTDKNGLPYRWGGWTKTGSKQCINDGCEEKTIDTHCIKCRRKALAKLAIDKETKQKYKDYLRGWAARIVSLNDPYVRACGRGNQRYDND